MRNSSIHTRITIKNTGSGFNELLNLFSKRRGKNPTPFNSLIPMPKEIMATEATSFDDDEPDFFLSSEEIYDKKNFGASRLMSTREIKKYKLPDPNKEILLNKYGVKNWFQWSIKNWGTTWEATNIRIKHHNKEEVLVTFTTYWPPPHIFIRKIAERYPQLTFACDIYSYEGHMTRACGYGPDLPFCIEKYCHVSSDEGSYEAALLSDRFIEFCSSFSKFPIGGTILKLHNPFDKSEPLDQIHVESSVEEG